MNAASWIDDFLVCYAVADNADLQIERGYLIKESNLPASIFKFRGVTDFALDNLQNDTVWLNSPANYNDPYDCAATISALEVGLSDFGKLPDHLFDPLRQLVSDAEIADARSSADPFDAILRLVITRDPKLTGTNPDALVATMKDAFRHVMQPRLEASIGTMRDNIKMCSFSERNDTLLMWSHYAQNHRGFCIEYDVSSLDPFIRRMLFPVIYRRERFDATPYHRSLKVERFNNLYGVIQALFKAPEWGYEQEWRFVLGHGILAEEQNYEFGTPCRVHLGPLISDTDREKVSAICSARGIAMSKMKLSSTEYTMISEPIT